ncbi:hypothetical protein OV090_33445 [Nannocystis sp. RBIL2]|uniref:hypothetical protein n=1 Tax=Nannocystis sp. RBIL2 TaxID=2996788 RepID=UPI00226F4998|nr:hypothetical protein [Nannocystis sp. RBIL2]MCY1069695.1 hypothetical protein [Nannocystis sp. RBIL2]
MSAPVPEDMGRVRLSAALDELGERVFGGRDGARRAAPLLERWDREVGVHTSVDSGHEALAAARVDWALCDAEPPGAAPGDTWAWRAATGRVPGIEPTPLYRLLATTQAGIFEVWPGAPLLLRDRLRGLSVRVDEPVPWLGESRRAAALWELRLAFGTGVAWICRTPIEYPLAIAPLLQRAHEGHWRAPQRIDLMPWRRQRLRWARDRRGEDPRSFFSGL